MKQSPLLPLSDVLPREPKLLNKSPDVLQACVQALKVRRDCHACCVCIWHTSGLKHLLVESCCYVCGAVAALD